MSAERLTKGRGRRNDKHPPLAPPLSDYRSGPLWGSCLEGVRADRQMKQRHKEAVSLDARMVLGSLGIQQGADFHSLSRSKVEGLLIEADVRRYQRPKQANGSRARYFHDMLQRHAKK